MAALPPAPSSSPPPRGRPASALAPVLAVSLVGLALLLAAARPVPTNDYSIYVAMGRQMMAQGSLLETDTFTFTILGEPFIHASWGYSLLCSHLWDLARYGGTRWLTVLAVVGTLLLVWRVCRQAGADVRASALAMLYAWVLLLQNVGYRSQTVVYPLFLLLVWLLQRSPPALWTFLLSTVLTWVWTQLHGSFPVAILYAGAVAVGRAFQARSWRGGIRGAAATLGAVVGSSLGPYGPAIWLYVWQNGAVPRERTILEWYTTDPLSFTGIRFYGALLLWGVLLVWRRGRLDAASWLHLAGFAFMGTTATRLVAWFGLASAVPLARVLDGGRADPPLRNRRNAALVGITVLFWGALLVRGIPARTRLAPDTPVDLVERMAEDAPTGRVFAPMEWGGYLAWRFHEPGPGGGHTPWPHFLDMRVWIFPDATWEAYLSISAADEDWERALDRWEVTHLLLSQYYHGDRLIPAARRSPRWEELHADDAGALFRRRKPHKASLRPPADP